MHFTNCEAFVQYTSIDLNTVHRSRDGQHTIYENIAVMSLFNTDIKIHNSRFMYNTASKDGICNVHHKL